MVNKDFLEKQTQYHYDRYPFIEGGESRIRWWREWLREFLTDAEIRDKLIIDVGSGVGEISRGLINRGARVVCLDISLHSLERCREINKEAEIFHGSALSLPFADESFNHSISIGVLHHTSDCRLGFKEVARVTAPGGTIVVFLYNYWSIYHLIYRLFQPVRKRIPLERVPIGIARLLQPFVSAHLKQKLDDVQLRNLLGDKLWTPQASFYSVSELCTWGHEEGLELAWVRNFFLGYANVLKFRKKDQRDNVAMRNVRMKCCKCNCAPMTKYDNKYKCTKCGHIYISENGIFKCLEN